MWFCDDGPIPRESAIQDQPSSWEVMGLAHRGVPPHPSNLPTDGFDQRHGAESVLGTPGAYTAPTPTGTPPSE